MFRLAVLASAALAGCIEIPAPAPDCDPGEDADGDGWTCDNPRAPDCDDGDPTVHPGALDAEDDGVDADCLGGDALPATPGGLRRVVSRRAGAVRPAPPDRVRPRRGGLSGLDPKDRRRRRAAVGGLG